MPPRLPDPKPLPFLSPELLDRLSGIEGIYVETLGLETSYAGELLNKSFRVPAAVWPDLKEGRYVICSIEGRLSQFDSTDRFIIFRDATIEAKAQPHQIERLLNSLRDSLRGGK